MAKKGSYSRRESIKALSVGAGVLGFGTKSVLAGDVDTAYVPEPETPIGTQWDSYRSVSRELNPRSSTSYEMKATAHLTVEKTGVRTELDGGTNYYVHELEICGLHSAIEEAERVPDDCGYRDSRPDPRCEEELFLDPFVDEYGIKITAHGETDFRSFVGNKVGIDGGPAYEEGDDEIVDTGDPDIGNVVDLVALALTKSHPVGATALSGLSVAKSLYESGYSYDESASKEIRWNPGKSPQTQCYASNHRLLEVWVPTSSSPAEITVSAFTKSKGTTYGGYLDISADETLEIYA